MMEGALAFTGPLWAGVQPLDTTRLSWIIGVIHYPPRTALTEKSKPANTAREMRGTD
jgi:hypothetical protein